jgi:hypothetical protein
VPEPEPEPEPEYAAPVEPLPPPVPLHPVVARVAAPSEGAGSWNLNDLRRLVDLHATEFPDRLDEWGSYLFLLRDYADVHGRIPAQFDWLIEDTFRELLVAG